MLSDMGVSVLCIVAFVIIDSTVTIYFFLKRLSPCSENFLFADIYWMDIRKYIQGIPQGKLTKIKKNLLIFLLLTLITVDILFTYALLSQNFSLLIFSLLFNVILSFLLYLYMVSILRNEYLKVNSGELEIILEERKLKKI